MTLILLAEAANAALNGDDLVVRQWAADCLRVKVDWSALKRPPELDGDALAMAAGLVEMMAQRAGQKPPPWTASVGAASGSIYLMPREMRRLREVSELEGPEPLLRRNIFAMPDYLRLV